ncbi:S-layer homology domain-containing protein [Paenibacillus sp. HJGM_3]|uniref:S-layer homology domain-containing protein n=1 Tax=Paenibacillus sp. HJGM_3 TaxID=3379816 RepID=UPI00385FA706
MRRNLKRLALASVMSLTMLAQPALAATGTETPSATSSSGVPSPTSGTSLFASVKGLDYEARNLQYEAMKLSPTGWQVGMVISKEPYAVVTKVDTEGANVRIWTGVLARDYDDLLVLWDDLRVLASGKLGYHATDVEETMRSYFASPSQEPYRTKAYLGKVPWANIPTDPESAQKGTPKVTADGVLNVYGIAFDNPDRAVAPSTGSVTKSADIPDVVPTLKKFKETSVAAVPWDAASHWAKDEILDLMRKSIIEGYEDQTIRPDRTLSKAEFVTLLVKSLGLEPSKAPAAEYADLGQHWSQPMIAAAQQFGLLDKKPVELNFSPDTPITRIEMVVLASRVLKQYNVALQGSSITFNDTSALTATNTASLQTVIQSGLVGGYEDGSFRPQGSLTRAEAFKVISRLIQLL